MVKAEVLGVRCASGGDKDLVCGDELTLGQGEVDGAGAVPAGLGGLDVQVERDTGRSERSGHVLTREGLHPGSSRVWETIVTCEPRALNAVAISHPTTPPPMIANR